MKILSMTSSLQWKLQGSEFRQQIWMTNLFLLQEDKSINQSSLTLLRFLTCRQTSGCKSSLWSTRAATHRCAQFQIGTSSFSRDCRPQLNLQRWTRLSTLTSATSMLLLWDLRSGSQSLSKTTSFNFLNLEAVLKSLRTKLSCLVEPAITLIPLTFPILLPVSHLHPSNSRLAGFRRLQSHICCVRLGSVKSQTSQFGPLAITCMRQTHQWATFTFTASRTSNGTTLDWTILALIDFFRFKY